MHSTCMASLANDRAKSAAVREKRSVRLHSPLDVRDLRRSYISMNLIHVENITLKRGSHRNWLSKQRQISSLSLSVFNSRIPDSSLLIPPMLVRRCQKLTLKITDPSPEQISLLALRRAFRIPKYVKSASIGLENPNLLSYSVTKSSIRHLVKGCEELSLSFDFYNPSITENPIRNLNKLLYAAEKLQRLSVMASDDFNLPLLQKKTLESLQCMKLRLLPMRLGLNSKNSWDCLEAMTSLQSLEIILAEDPLVFRDYSYMLKALSRLPQFEELKVSIVYDDISGNDLITAFQDHISLIKFRILQFRVNRMTYFPKNRLDNLMRLVMALTGKDRTEIMEKQLTRSNFKTLEFTLKREGQRYAFESLEAREAKNISIPLDIFTLSEHTRELNFEIQNNHEDFTKLGQYFTEQISHCKDLNKLTLEINGMQRNLKSSGFIDNFFLTNLPKLQNLAELEVKLTGSEDHLPLDPRVVSQFAFAMSNLQNIRHLTLEIGCRLGEKVSISSITESVKALAKLEKLELLLEDNVPEQEIIKLFEALTKCRKLFSLHLKLWPLGSTELIEQLPALINKLTGVRMIDLWLKTRNRLKSEKKLSDFLMDLRRTVVHRQTMEYFNVVVSNKSLYFQLQELCGPRFSIPS